MRAPPARAMKQGHILFPQALSMAAAMQPKGVGRARASVSGPLRQGRLGKIATGAIRAPDRCAGAFSSSSLISSRSRLEISRLGRQMCGCGGGSGPDPEPGLTTGTFTRVEERGAGAQLQKVERV